MTNEIWLNLPVGDLDRTREFYTRIGFSLKNDQPAAEMACFEVGGGRLTVAFVARATFESFSQTTAADPRAGAQVLISLDAASRDHVDETARRVFEAGGTIFGAPAEKDGRTYGFGFTDPDGHRWNMVYPDRAKRAAA